MFNHNKLTVYIDKTKYMLISNKKDSVYTPIDIEGQSLCKVNILLISGCYLGVIIDQDLRMVSQPRGGDLVSSMPGCVS